MSCTYMLAIAWLGGPVPRDRNVSWHWFLCPKCTQQQQIRSCQVGCEPSNVSAWGEKAPVSLTLNKEVPQKTCLSPHRVVTMDTNREKGDDDPISEEEIAELENEEPTRGRKKARVQPEQEGEEATQVCAPLPGQ